MVIKDCRTISDYSFMHLKATGSNTAMIAFANRAAYLRGHFPRNQRWPVRSERAIVVIYRLFPISYGVFESIRS